MNNKAQPKIHLTDFYRNSDLQLHYFVAFCILAKISFNYVFKESSFNKRFTSGCK